MTPSIVRFGAAALLSLLLTAIPAATAEATPPPVPPAPLLSAAAPPDAGPAARPDSGDVVASRGDDGPGRVEIVGGTVDAVLSLAEDGRVVRTIYVRAGETAVVDTVPDGDHQVFVISGRGWDDESDRFTRNATYERWPGRYAFTTGEDDQGTWSTEWTFELSPAVDGNVTPEPIAAELYPH